MDAGADEILLAGNIEAPVCRPRGHDHGVRGELLARGQGRHEVLAVVLDGGDRHGRKELHPVAAGLGDEPLGQLGARDPVGKPRVVVDPVADPSLAAEGAGVDDDGVDAFPSGVDGGRQPRWSAPNDDEVVGGPIGLEGQADAVWPGPRRSGSPRGSRRQRRR